MPITLILNYLFSNYRSQDSEDYVFCEINQFFFGPFLFNFESSCTCSDYDKKIYFSFQHLKLIFFLQLIL